MVACACKCQRRYEITSYCNKFLESEKLKRGGAVCESRMLAWESKIEKGVVNRKTERQEKMCLFCLCILIPHTWEQYPGWSVSAGCSWVADKAAAQSKTPTHRESPCSHLLYASYRTFHFTVCSSQAVAAGWDHWERAAFVKWWPGKKGFYWWFVSTVKGVLLWSSNSKNSVPVSRNQESRGTSGIDRRTR